jgi:hypothetical protein
MSIFLGGVLPDGEPAVAAPLPNLREHAEKPLPLACEFPPSGIEQGTIHDYWQKTVFILPEKPRWRILSRTPLGFRLGLVSFTWRSASAKHSRWCGNAGDCGDLCHY